MKRLHELALVLVHALGLRVDDRIGIDLDRAARAHPFRKRALVRGFHLAIGLAERLVLRIRLELGNLAPILHEAFADSIVDQMAQGRIGHAQPTTLRNTVGDAEEALGVDNIEITEQRRTQNLPMQLGHAIDMPAQQHAKIGHAHLTTLDDGRAVHEVGIARELLPNTVAEPCVDGLENAVNARQQSLHGCGRPFLKRLGHDSMVGVVEGALNDVDRLFPREVLFVDKNANELGDSKRRMRIVDLYCKFIRYCMQISVVALMRVDERLHGSRDQEVELTQA